eukprot:3270265-Rhodomonas_salina.1
MCTHAYTGGRRRAVVKHRGGNAKGRPSRTAWRHPTPAPETASEGGRERGRKGGRERGTDRKSEGEKELSAQQYRGRTGESREVNVKHCSN